MRLVHFALAARTNRRNPSVILGVELSRSFRIPLFGRRFQNDVRGREKQHPAANDRSTLAAWRQSIDLETAMTDQFKILMMANRRQILENLLQTGSGWEQLLRCARGMEGHDEADLRRLRKTVQEFVEWAASELDHLNALGPTN